MYWPMVADIMGCSGLSHNLARDIMSLNDFHNNRLMLYNFSVSFVCRNTTQFSVSLRPEDRGCVVSGPWLWCDWAVGALPSPLRFSLPSVSSLLWAALMTRDGCSELMWVSPWCWTKPMKSSNDCIVDIVYKTDCCDSNCYTLVMLLIRTSRGL